MVGSFGGDGDALKQICDRSCGLGAGLDACAAHWSVVSVVAALTHMQQVIVAAVV